MDILKQFFQESLPRHIGYAFGAVTCSLFSVASVVTFIESIGEIQTDGLTFVSTLILIGAPVTFLLFSGIGTLVAIDWYRDR